MSSGFVYVLTNEAMPGVVKIGQSSRHPKQRADELFTTGVPVPFTVYFAIYAPDYLWCEREIHDILQNDRMLPNREFFKIDPTDAVTVVMDVIARNFDCRTVSDWNVVDDGDYARYMAMSGCQPPEVLSVIDEFTEKEWKAAYYRFDQARINRNKAREKARLAQANQSEISGAVLIADGAEGRPVQRIGQAATDRPRIEQKPDPSVAELAGRLRIEV